MSRLRIYAPAIILLALTLSPEMLVAKISQKPREVMVKKEGWLIPGRDDFRKMSKVVEKNIEGVAVTHKILEARGEIIVDVEGRKVKLFVKRKSDVRLFSVRGFSVYETEGRVFAYGVDLVPVFFTGGKNYREKTYAGAMYNLFYVDDDGDGVFESRYGGLILRELPARLRRNA